MTCNIEYVGKKRNGKSQYYCTIHKSFASDKNGNKLDSCLCLNKRQFDNLLDLNNIEIKDIRIIYDNILECTIPKILIDNKEFDGVLIFDNSILTYKDLSGIMLAKLNNMPVETVECHRCHRKHSDNGKFAYTPHSVHLCLYCGHLFHVKEKNVGSELAFIYDIPNMILKDREIDIDGRCQV